VKRRSHRWRPPTDVYETDDAYQVRVEVAGMKGSDISVTFDRQVLLIQGTRSDSGPRKEYRQLEVAYGEFETAVELPEPVEVSRIEASYLDGFLKVRLPKLKPRRVSIGG
jgi:HSP20 family protein